jgi:hypothetical protein
MTKIVVVVDSKCGEFYKELFEGEKLVATTIGNLGPSECQTLEISEGDKLLAQFSEWTYWRYTE